MSQRRVFTRAKKKLVMLTGTARPREELRQLIAFHSFENPEHVLRIASPKKVELETKALQKRFPEIGRRVAKKPVAERTAVLERLDALGRKRVEAGLKKGFALQELLVHSTEKELAAFVKRTTPERVKLLKGLGFSEINARNYCRLVEKRGWKNTKVYIEQLKSIGLDINRVSPEVYREFYVTGKNFIESAVIKRTPEEERLLGITPEKAIFESRMNRKRFVDFRRHGKPLFSKGYGFSHSQAEILAAKGIKAFEFTGKVRKIASSNMLVGKMSNRHAFYLEVPEIASLVKEARPGRQHLRHVLGFADLALTPNGKAIHIFELQSDVAEKLGPSREKYKSWAEMAVLGVADFAAKNGYEHISMSSPHMIKQVWPYLGKNLTRELYYDLPKKMGFELVQAKKKITHYDSAFGQQQFGKSGVLWDVKVETIKKNFPEFFK